MQKYIKIQAKTRKIFLNVARLSKNILRLGKNEKAVETAVKVANLR